MNYKMISILLVVFLFVIIGNKEIFGTCPYEPVLCAKLIGTPIVGSGAETCIEYYLGPPAQSKTIYVLKGSSVVWTDGGSTDSDSYYDGGLWQQPDNPVEHVLEGHTLVDENGSVSWTEPFNTAGSFPRISTVNDSPPPAVWSPESATPEFTVVACEITSITVISGATQTNVVQNWPNGGDQNWGCVKASGEYVIVEVTTTPNTEAVWDFLVWNNGEAVTGHKNQRKYSRSDSQKYTVQPTIFGSSLNPLYIWVIWSTIEFRTSGTKSTGNNKSFLDSEGGNTLGPANDEDDGITVAEAIGKVEIVVTITPASTEGNLYHVFQNGWDIKRWVEYEWYGNGALSKSESKDDDQYETDEDLIPDNDGKIYCIDSPSCGKNFNVNHTAEVYDNFREWVIWNNVQCSSDRFWHYYAYVDDDLDPSNKPRNDDTEMNDIGEGISSLPGSAHYPVR